VCLPLRTRYVLESTTFDTDGTVSNRKIRGSNQIFGRSQSKYESGNNPPKPSLKALPRILSRGEGVSAAGRTEASMLEDFPGSLGRRDQRATINMCNSDAPNMCG
jgi:hypothetical protein